MEADAHPNCRGEVSVSVRSFHFKRWQALCVELLAHKFRYYILDNPTISDTEYDIKEKEWLTLGAKVGRTRTPPFWVGFDCNHPFVHQARDKALGRL